jgi:hypothetical protein
MNAMTIRTFDRLACGLILAVFTFSACVAFINWDWFPVKGEWGEIAHIPPTFLNYFALLSPPVVLLVYLLIRRIWLKQPF